MNAPLEWFVLLSFLRVSWQTSSITRAECGRDSKFENPKKGYVLENHVISSLNVGMAFDCVVHCLEKPACKSINFKRTGTADNVCELNDKTEEEVALTTNSDYTYYGPSKRSGSASKCKFGGTCIPSCNSDECNCACTPGRTGPKCEHIKKNVAVHLQFPRVSVEDYVLIQNSADFGNVTISFWINKVNGKDTTLFSYAIEGSYEEISVALRYSKLTFTIKSSHSMDLYFAKVQDGFWHHICLQWSGVDTSYSAFIDGIKVYSSSGLATIGPLRGNGYFAIGQKQSGVGGPFDASSSFTGKLNQLNIWDRTLSQADVVMLSSNCLSDGGSLVNWNKDIFLNELKGEVTIEDSQCKSLRQDNNYNVVMSASANTTDEPSYVISSGITKGLQYFTVAMWTKQTRGYTYFQYATDVQAETLSFSLVAASGVLRLVIGGQAYHVRVPLFWRERPAYWHHLVITWSSVDAIWRTFLDGALVSLRKGIRSNYIIPSGGTLVIGNTQTSVGVGMSLDETMDGSLSGLNIWNAILNLEAVSTMAKGPFCENGNWFRWYGVKSKAVGDLSFEAIPSDLYNNRNMTSFELVFPSKSISNYIRVDGAVTEPLNAISTCFWAKLAKTGSTGVITYSTTDNIEELSVVFLGSAMKMSVRIKDVDINSRLLSESLAGPHTNWHFYCAQWRSSDGRTEIYVDRGLVASGVYSQGLLMSTSGSFIIGQKIDSHVGSFDINQGFVGSLTLMNVWENFLTLNEIVGMACGSTNINGNVLQWRNLRDKIAGNIAIQSYVVSYIPDYSVQMRRDAYCRSLYGSTYARFMQGSKGNAYNWRCARHNPTVLNLEHMLYVSGSGYFSHSGQLESIN